MSEVVVIANEPISPPLNGGRVRMTALVEALRRHHTVRVHEPSGKPRTLRQTFTLAPRRGTAALANDDVRVDGADVVVYTHSYLAPVGPATDRPVVVDFQNLEIDRQRSFAREGDVAHRASAAAEALKARWWEPRTARRAALCIAVSDEDAAVLRGWGARHVVVAPNASDAVRCDPSPAEGPVTFFADHTYGPNAAASLRLVRDVWPRVAAARPGARLRVCGRGTGDVVADAADAFGAASLLLAPVDRGAGTQLKVVEALAHGRIVIATPHSARSAPTSARDACIETVDAADMASAIVRLLDDIDERHRRERTARVPTWAEAMAPVLAAVDDLR